MFRFTPYTSAFPYGYVAMQRIPGFYGYVSCHYLAAPVVLPVFWLIAWTIDWLQRHTAKKPEKLRAMSRHDFRNPVAGWLWFALMALYMLPAKRAYLLR